MSTLDAMVRAAAPVTDEQIEALLTGIAAEELRAAIKQAPRSSGTPARRRAPRLVLPRLGAVALATAAVVAVVLTIGSGERGTGRAWAAPALRVANAVPRLLIGADGWRVTRADEFTVNEGEMVFSDGTHDAQLSWSRRGSGPKAYDRDPSLIRVGSATVAGAEAAVYRYRGSNDDFVARWRSHGYWLQLRADYLPKAKDDLTLEQYRAVLTSLHIVGVDEWLSAMPASVVQPTDTRKTIDAMLRDIPIPPRFDKASLYAGKEIHDRYDLGAKVAGAVACTWIARWVTARASGDSASEREATAAMQTSRHWAVLREMNAEGDYPELIWDYAHAMAGDGYVFADRTLAEDYSDGLGCSRNPG